MLKFTVKQARQYAGLSMKEMGECLGMCKDTYSSREKDPSKFTIPEGEKISKKTGIPMDLLIF